MNMHEDQGLKYLADNGYAISPAEYYRIKNEIKSNTQERLNLIASKEWISQHIERIDMLRTIQKELWSNYHLEKNPSKKANILMQIAEIQLYLSSFYDSTQYVMQKSVRKESKQIEC